MTKNGGYESLAVILKKTLDVLGQVIPHRGNKHKPLDRLLSPGVRQKQLMGFCRGSQGFTDYHTPANLL